MKRVRLEWHRAAPFDVVEATPSVPRGEAMQASTPFVSALNAVAQISGLEFDGRLGVRQLALGTLLLFRLELLCNVRCAQPSTYANLLSVTRNLEGIRLPTETRTDLPIAAISSPIWK